MEIPEHTAPLWKISNSFKLPDASTKEITSIKYVMDLVHCTSEELAKIYNLLANSRLIIHTSYSDETRLASKQQWLKLIQERSENLLAKSLIERKGT